ncbi:nuclear receptor 2C2-associated protein-like [Ornithodoros turicata]|uniref:nuclear receptor 2C2-associated protein-like n=1 Tax=Ornithodoros turicata TaxID=34597 RepID=UPI00313A3D75
MASLITPDCRIRVSSVLNKDAKQFGKKHLTDGVDDTCWNSDQGTPQWIHIEFPSPVLPTELQMQFQGGFVGKDVHLESVDSTVSNSFVRVCDIYPSDDNSTQSFPVKLQNPVVALRILFGSSTDMFGRIVLYKLDCLG